MSDLISIIIPVYNLEQEIERCLKSIINQTYQNIEIIVVDDGSTDQSGKILDAYAESYKVIKVLHIPNSGVTNARITGIKEAKGEWIGFVDGDDEIKEDMYELLIGNAKKYQADISHCGFEMRFSDGRTNYFHNTGCIIEQNSIEAIEALLDGSIIEPGLCNKLFKKNLFQQFESEELMDTSIKINEDLLMNYYLFSKANKLVFEDICKYHYIVREESASRQRINSYRIFDPIKVKKIIMDHCVAALREASQRAYVNTCIYTYASLVLEKEYEYRNEKKKIREELKNHLKWCKLTGKKTKILAMMIIRTPKCFERIYPIYVSRFQKNQYE